MGLVEWSLAQTDVTCLYSNWHSDSNAQTEWEEALAWNSLCVEHGTWLLLCKNNCFSSPWSPDIHHAPKAEKAFAELKEESALFSTVYLSDHIALRNTNISADNYIEWVDKQCELSMTIVQATHCFSLTLRKQGYSESRMLNCLHRQI